MDDDVVVELDEEKAWELLSGTTFGRLALAAGGEPDIVPLNFYAGEGRIVFRSAEGSKLSEVAVFPQVAIEADSVGTEKAWSVVAKGSARILVATDEIAAADELPLHPWIPTLKYNYVEVTVDSISARTFLLGPEPDRPVGY